MITNHTLPQITHILKECSSSTIKLKCLDPSISTSLYNGEKLERDGIVYRYRPFQFWIDLAEELQYHVRKFETVTPQWIQITLEKYNQTSWHTDSLASGHHEKYGRHSEFTRLNKFEDPSFYLHFQYVMKRLACHQNPKNLKVLILGVNQGHEVDALLSTPSYSYDLIHGIDHSESAISYAKTKFLAHRHVKLDVADICQLEEHSLTSYDLIMAINTLHSPQIDGQKVIRMLSKKHLNPRGSFLLGFPQSRHIDHHLCFGLRSAVEHTVDMHKVFKGIYSYQRYLQQHQFQVELIGKYTVLLLARRLG